MAKQALIYQCTACHHTTNKWLGQCPGCQEWNTLTQQQSSSAAYSPKQGKSAIHRTATPAPQLHRLITIQRESQQRMESSLKEWDRVLGGGILPGSFIMLTGDPGIGKSTLLLQVAHNLAERYPTLYFSSEESLEQVRSRAERIECLNTQLLFSDQANLDAIIAAAQEYAPKLIIIDSIQNCYSPESDTTPGSISQLKEATFRLLRLAKEQNIAILLSGHITKEGVMAGPKTLEHMVDAVFYLQGEDRWQTRILRSVKNRFGTIDEIGFFTMHETGLRELPNVNEQVLAELSEAPGAALVSSLEGTRPLLVELQALTIGSHFSMPQRLVSGIDQKQVVLIAAILEKYLQIKFSSQDIFFKVTGGIKLKGNSADLGIALALLSSYFQQALAPRTIALGEVSLTGHIKPISHIGHHLNEAKKFGITKIYISEQQKIETPSSRIKSLRTVYDLLTLFPTERKG